LGNITFLGSIKIIFSNKAKFQIWGGINNKFKQNLKCLLVDFSKLDFAMNTFIPIDSFREVVTILIKMFNLVGIS
jgi:hypothetical protein